MRGENDGDGSGQFHAETTGWRVEGDAVTEDCHDVVTVGSETKDEHTTTESESPDVNLGAGTRDSTGGPGVVDDGEGTNGIGNVVGTMSEGGNTGGHNLHEGIKMLGAVRISGVELVNVVGVKNI